MKEEIPGFDCSSIRCAIGLDIGGIAVSAVLTLVLLPVLYELSTPELGDKSSESREK